MSIYIISMYHVENVGIPLWHCNTAIVTSPYQNVYIPCIEMFAFHKCFCWASFGPYLCQFFMHIIIDMLTALLVSLYYLSMEFEVLMPVNTMIIVFWDVMPCCMVDSWEDLFCPEDGGSRSLQKVCTYPSLPRNVSLWVW